MKDNLHSWKGTRNIKLCPPLPCKHCREKQGIGPAQAREDLSHNHGVQGPVHQHDEQGPADVEKVSVAWEDKRGASSSLQLCVVCQLVCESV